MKTRKQITKDKFNELIEIQFTDMCNRIDKEIKRQKLTDKNISQSIGIAAYRIGLIRKAQISPQTTLLTFLKIFAYLGIKC